MKAVSKDEESDAAMSSTLFPMFLRLEGRDALVVGAGHVAEPKIESLLRAGARVRVVAPQAIRQVAAWANERRVRWERRSFRAGDMEGAFLVIAATSSPRLHARILLLARRAAILCNVVDDPERCDFFYPAVVRRGDLQIAVSTGGASPALAQRLRKELEKQFGPEYETWIQHLRRARHELREQGLTLAARGRRSHQLADRSELAAFTRRAHTRRPARAAAASTNGDS
jgi:precorrin-2 dehydrogenase / sirohydrochlorin ferrochelatase